MKKKFIFTQRFYAFIMIIMSLILLPMCIYLNDGDITSFILLFPLSIGMYISTFMDDEEDE
jgi:hypothetical protein